MVMRQEMVSPVRFPENASRHISQCFSQKCEQDNDCGCAIFWPAHETI
jgi:hypothetical protein